MKRWLLALLFLGMMEPLAQAESLTAEIALFYMNDSGVRSLTDNNDEPYTLKTKTNYTFTALGFCYRMDWFCIGLKYLQGGVETRASNSTSSTSVTSTETFSGPGVTLGASVNEWVAHATFLIGGQKRVNDKVDNGFSSSTTGVKYPASSATLLDLGYGFQVGSVRVGPLLSVLHMDYKKRIYNGTTESLPSKESDDFIMPHFALWVDF
ncbi:hypothetical protein [Oligoflexus tunisiensis]|uniref:hypothetical protein n=1 Tax=Oligoflexus tunisiensis TaxID=708132 RepID=UPI00114C9F16|nr:hypothetical protein [Oligoflexus tunisiensis]